MGRTAKVRAVVLLQGPPGSGQQEAVAQAAKAIGVHLVPICCEELRGPSDYKTAAALKSTYELAADVGPAILLLKNLPALLDSQSPTGARLAACNNVTSSFYRTPPSHPPPPPPSCPTPLAKKCSIVRDMIKQDQNPL